ncbi:MAG: mevalonate kinase [Pseudomonadota bacterium]
MVGRGRACGKVILFGEHFVLYGGTAVAVPLHVAERRVVVASAPSGVRLLEGTSLDGERCESLLEIAVQELGLDRSTGLRAEVSGDLPVGMGLGSSAALCVALARAIIDLYGEEPDDDLVSIAAFEMEHLFHGTPSGIDTTTVTFETPCFLKGGGDWAGAEAPPVDGPVAGFVDIPAGLPMIVACSGTPGDTLEAVKRLARLRDDPRGGQTLERLTAVADNLALRGASALRDGAWDAAGDLMNENHYLLSALDLSTEHIDELRRAAILAGAWGAKLTGAGLGGSLVVLAPPALHPVVARELRIAGATAVFLPAPQGH